MLFYGLERLNVVSADLVDKLLYEKEDLTSDFYASARSSDKKKMACLKDLFPYSFKKNAYTSQLRLIRFSLLEGYVLFQINI